MAAGGPHTGTSVTGVRLDVAATISLPLGAPLSPPTVPHRRRLGHDSRPTSHWLPLRSLVVMLIVGATIDMTVAAARLS